MSSLDSQIRAARRRLFMRSLAVKLALSLALAIGIAAASVLIGKVWPSLSVSLPALLAGAVLTSTLAASVWTWIERPTLLDSAIEIDRRFGLGERISSALTLDPEQLATPFGAALTADAARRSGRLSIDERFPISLHRQKLLPLASAALALVLAMLVPAREPVGVEAATASARVQQPAQALARRIAARRQDAARQGLDESNRILAEVERGAENLAQRTIEPKQALVELNDLVVQAERRRRELAADANLREQLSALKPIDLSVAAKLAQALKRGDFARAAAELQELAPRLDATPAGREQATQELSRLSNMLIEQANASRQAQRDLERQVAAQQNAGQMAAAENLQQRAHEMAERNARLDALDQLAGAMKDAAAQAGSNTPQQSLARLQGQLEQLAKDARELTVLEGAFADLAACKQTMACPQCDGAGCEACQNGHVPKAAKSGSPQDKAIGQGGSPSRGSGQMAAGNFYDAQVKPATSEGPTIEGAADDAPSHKGEVREPIGNHPASAPPQLPSEAISQQRLPRAYREHARAYFDALRESHE
jgi:hypothetical protein